MDEQTTEAPKTGGNKTVWIVLAILVIAGLAWFAMSKKGENGIKSDDQKQEEQKKAEPMSLKELMAQGKAQQCTFSSSAEYAKTEGKVYFADGKMRGDFSVTNSDKTVVSHMLSEGQTMYTWMDGMSAGYKMTIAEGSQGSAGQNNEQGISSDAKYEYNCSAWTPYGSVFSLPDAVTFTDMSAMMPGNGSSPAGNGGASATMKAQQCAACDTLSSDQKAQCKAALSCN